MTSNTDDLRIRRIEPLSPPSEVIAELPATPQITDTVAASRDAIHRILNSEDDRVLVVVGPCSIHDPKAALEYAERLVAVRERLAGELEVVMRVYFEKPRTTVGWKGLINDPHLDGSFRIDEGLRLARKVLLQVTGLGLPAAGEFLDVATPQYIADLVSWGAIGARTTESQIHREMASGLSCPVGFKNGTDGGIKVAADAVLAANAPHRFLAVTKDGQVAIAETTGNDDSHIVLRGGAQPNYDAASVEAACQALKKAGLRETLMIDASHANSSKDPNRQPIVVDDIAGQLAAGDRRIMGVMIESNLVGGRQDLVPGKPLVYGCSITDGCIGWDDTVASLDRLAEAVRQRRLKAAA
jgi:3-deoxy-7-phosphoheptulonate synthase